MAERQPTMTFEDIPLEQARTMSRGRRMDPQLYHALRQKIQSLSTAATRMALLENVSPTTMKNRILRVASELKIPVTIRKVPGSLVFWRSTAEDVTHAREIAERLQRARRRRSRGRRRR